MKKLFALTLALIMALSLVACSTKDSSENKTTNSNSVVTSTDMGKILGKWENNENKDLRYFFGDGSTAYYSAGNERFQDIEEYAVYDDYLRIGKSVFKYTISGDTLTLVRESTGDNIIYTKIK